MSAAAHARSATRDSSFVIVVGSSRPVDGSSVAIPPLRSSDFNVRVPQCRTIVRRRRRYHLAFVADRKMIIHSSLETGSSRRFRSAPDFRREFSTQHAIIYHIAAEVLLADNPLKRRE